MRISQIWRYPVKSMQGERVDASEVTTHGLVGDRGWGLVDVESGKTLTARREPNLLFAQAKLTDDGAGVRVVLPSGDATVGDPATDNAMLSAWVGRPVELRRATETSAGTFETQLDETETGDWFSWTGREGSFHDSTKSPISLVSEPTMRDWDARRFRINVVFDTDGEDDLVGQTVQLGTAELLVMKQIDRCVMTTRPQPASEEGAALERDLSVLRTINAERATLLGVGCLVQTPGRIAIGDLLSPNG